LLNFSNLSKNNPDPESSPANALSTGPWLIANVFKKNCLHTRTCSEELKLKL